MKRIGLVTIGQSPRSDVTPMMQEILGPGVQIVELGALDDLDETGVAPQPSETLLVSRMRDGRQVSIARERIAPLVQRCITRLEADDISIIILMCTARFPGGFQYRGLLLEPERLIGHLVAGILGEGRLGIMVPEADQQCEMAGKWALAGPEVVTACGSPYGPMAAVEHGARQLCELQPAMIVLDCIGYRPEHKETVARITGVPVILSNALIARVAAELV